MKARAPIAAALGCAMCAAIAIADEQRVSEITVSTAERLRLEYAPSSAARIDDLAARPTVAEMPVLKLPRLDVRERPVPLRPHELLTPKGRLAIARQTTLSPMYRSTFGPLSWAAMAYFNPLALLTGAKPNDAEAMVLYEQNEDLRRQREIQALQDLSTLAERAAAAEKRPDESSFRRASRGTRGGAD